MKARKKAIIVLVVIASLFGFSQYASASQISVTVTESQLLEQDDTKSKYNVQLEFHNPSLLVLNTGKTEFIVSVEDKKIGDGTLEPFVLPAVGSVVVDGTFQAESGFEEETEDASLKISGVTKYDIFFTSLDIPFEYYPTEQQAREFIQQN